MAVVERLLDMSPRARTELLDWLELWFDRRNSGRAGVFFNSKNDAIARRYLDIVTTALDPDGYGYQLISKVSGDVLIGFPWDDTDEYLGALSGDVILGVGYGGNRAFRFRVTDDVGDGSYSETVVIVVGPGGGVRLNKEGSIDLARTISMQGLYGGLVGTQLGKWIGFVATGPPAGVGFAEGDWAIAVSDGRVWTYAGAGAGGWHSTATVADLASYVPTSRTLTAGAGLTGGGDLSANRTFDVNVDGSTIEVAADVVQVKDAGITGAKLEDSGVAAGTYGDATHVPQVTVDAKGRVTSATEFAFSSDPSLDTAVWMPLTTVVAGVPELVWDADDSLIPDLVPV